MQVFPLALPLIILVIGPLAVLAVAGLLLALPILLPLLLGRAVLRALSRLRKSERALAPGHP